MTEREELLMAALGFLEARLHNETHPEDPYSEASCEMYGDMLDDAAKKYATALENE